MREQQPPDGGDWFEELTGEGEAAPDDGTPTDFLRRIMADATQTGTARVAAAKVLMERGGARARTRPRWLWRGRCRN